MKVYLSADIEGIAGVVDETQWLLGEPRHEMASDLMAGEVNAAVEGALAAGAAEIVVNDSHHLGINILPERLHPAADLLSGRVKPLSMCQGMEHGADAALFVGYHAGVGARAGCLDHTYTGLVQTISINGRAVSEGILNGLVAGHFGIPLVLVTGDQTTAAEMTAWEPKIHTCVVKESVGRKATRSVHPAKAREMIRTAAEGALAARGEIPPLRIEPPLTLDITFERGQMADICERLVGIERVGGCAVRAEADDMLTIFRHFLAIITVAGTVR